MIKRAFILSAALIFSAVALSGCGVYSEGERSGQITKLSTKGLIFKTDEGQLVMSGMRRSSDGEGNTSIIANTFEFSVVNQSVANDINRAAREGIPVTITYDQYLIPYPPARKTSYIVRKVTFPK